MELSPESPGNMNLFVGLEWGLANYSPWARTCVYKTVLLIYATFIHLCIVYPCFHATRAELSSFDRPYGLQSRKYLLNGPVWKKVC